MTATITTPTSWTDTERDLCTCTSRECNAFHAADDLFDERYALYLDGETEPTYTAMDIEAFAIELCDMNSEQPFQPDEAIVRDLATGAQMTARSFVLEFAEYAA